MWCIPACTARGARVLGAWPLTAGSRAERSPGDTALSGLGRLKEPGSAVSRAGAGGLATAPPVCWDLEACWLCWWFCIGPGLCGECGGGRGDSLRDLPPRPISLEGDSSVRR